jgi:hypothetical protein
VISGDCERNWVEGACTEDLLDIVLLRLGGLKQSFGCGVIS